ncbi:hypothetical protein QR685DRAFT_450446, partial [Neurospora intermedia]
TGWNAYCLTTTIYESYPSATNSWVSYGCSDVTGDRQFTLYRNLDIPLASTTTTSFAQDSDGPAKTASPELSMSGVASQPTDNSDSTKSSSSGSKAWIAAAAAGPVVALLVIGALIFRCGAISQVRRGV